MAGRIKSEVGRAKRPPRRYYEVTDTGKAALGAVLVRARSDARFRPVLAPRAAGSLI